MNKPGWSRPCGIHCASSIVSLDFSSLQAALKLLGCLPLPPEISSTRENYQHISLAWFWFISFISLTYFVFGRKIGNVSYGRFIIKELWWAQRRTKCNNAIIKQLMQPFMKSKTASELNIMWVGLVHNFWLASAFHKCLFRLVTFWPSERKS